MAQQDPADRRLLASVGFHSAAKKRTTLQVVLRVSLKASKSGLLPGVYWVLHSIGGGFFLSDLVQFEILGLRREQQTDKRHNCANRQNHGRRQPQVLLLDGINEGNLVGHKDIDVEPRTK